MNRSDDYLDHTGSALAEPDTGHDDSAARAMNTCVFCDLPDGLHKSDCRLVSGVKIPMHRAETDLLRMRIEHLENQVTLLTAERDKLKACAEHYADERNWTTATDFDDSYVIYSADFPMPGEGWAVAREALGNADTPGLSRGELIALIRDLAYTDPCRLDAHGYCQAHAWLSEQRCPHARASEALDGKK